MEKRIIRHITIKSLFGRLVIVYESIEITKIVANDIATPAHKLWCGGHLA